MKASWIPYAAEAIPRYTSYPTAVQFHEGVDGSTVAGWLAGLTADDPLSIYAHVPFCEQLCWYCGCHTSVPNGYARIARYVESLHREIEVWAGAISEHGGARELHFGGGSPNALSADDFFAVSEHLRTAFRLHDDAEFSVELDPRSLTPERIAAMASAGVTRASLGVQTLSERVQKAVNRVQPRESLVESICALRGAAIEAVNMDLMYGLPEQTVEDALEAAGFAIAMRADRVAVFGYAHVPWFARHQKAINAADLPGMQARFEQAEAMAGALMSAGYVAIGLDHYAKPLDPMARAAAAGTLRRNFQGYTTDPCETLIGLGPSSISAFREGYAQNAKDMPAWSGAVDEGRLPIVRGVGVTGEDRLRRRAIERLMCDLRVDAGAVCVAAGVDAGTLDEAVAQARDLSEAGLCRVDGRVITVAPDARALMRVVARCFDAYTPRASGGRHARAV